MLIGNRNKLRATRATRATRAGVLALVIAGIIVGCSSTAEETPPPEPVAPFTPTEASSTYLSTICPVNAAWDEVDRLIDDMRSALVIHTDDIEVRENLIEQQLQQLAQESTQAATTLEATEEAMPEGARSPMKEMALTLHADADQALQVAQLEAEHMVDHVWEGTTESAAVTERVREALGLNAENAPTCDQL